MVQNEPYTEKADIWAAGCLLYQMSTLSYPFHSPNLLKLAQQVTNAPKDHMIPMVLQIVECNYQPLPSNKYSDKLSAVIARCVKMNCLLVVKYTNRCLTVDSKVRPDIVEVVQPDLAAPPIII